MKVLHIQYGMTHAGNAAYRLHEAMLRIGIDSYCMTLMNNVVRGNVICFDESLLHKAVRVGIQRVVSMWKLRKFRDETLPYHNIPVIGCGVVSHQLIKEADIIYLHWIANGISLNELHALLSMDKPIIVFLHDMWIITGGCNYSLGCKRFMTGCENCGLFKNGATTSEDNLIKKISMFSNRKNVLFMTPSEWMKGCAENSLVTQKCKICHVPNYVDDNVFKPIDKRMARSILNLPQDKILITFGCQSGVRNKLKGWEYMIQAINMLPYEKDMVNIVIYGSDYNAETEKSIKYPIHFLGPIWDEHKLMLICNSSSLFVSPSLGESFGLTLLENTLCNTPVVSFDNTAIPEIVKTGKNGYLAKNKDVDDLAKSIEWTLSQKFGDIRSISEYSSEKVLETHLSIIREMTKN